MTGTEQPDVATCDADDGRYRFRVQRLVGKVHAGRRPALLQQLPNLRSSQGPKFMDKTDTGVELGVARHAHFKPWYSN